MRSIRPILWAAALSIAAAMPSLASAQTVQARVNYIPNAVFEGASALSNTSYTNATTTATILTGTDLVVPATPFDPAKRLFTACWSADVTKSTSTTGSIDVRVGGVSVTGSARFSASAAGRNSIGGCFSWIRAAATAQTVALYAVSADTASFAVQNAQMTLTQTVFLP